MENVFETPFKNDIDTTDEELTIIGSSTVIEGKENSSIVCGGNIEIKGRVNGKVNVAGSTVITGVVEGDITTDEMIVNNGAKISGNVNCKSTLNVNEGSSVVGDIVAKNTYVASSVTGNIDSANEVRIASEGSVTGNISTGSISVESGAVINGNLAINRKQENQVNLGSPFLLAKRKTP